MKSKEITADNKEVYDEYSSIYDETRSSGLYKLLDEVEVNVLLKHIPDNRVLELGTGTGLIQNRIQSVVKSVVGVDISLGMLQHAKMKNLDVVCGDILDLPLPDNSFDVVYSYKVFPHIKNLPKAFKEIKRVLTPNGVFIVEFYNAFSIRYLVKLLRKPNPISKMLSEADLYERFDSPMKAKNYLSVFSSTQLAAGVRFLGLISPLYKVKYLGDILIYLDRILAYTPLKYFSGHIIYISFK